MKFKVIQDEAKRLWAAANNTSAANARWASTDELAPFYAEARRCLFLS